MARSFRRLSRRLPSLLGRRRTRRLYDHWMAMTRRMSRSLSADEIVGELVERVVRGAGAMAAAVYLSRSDETVYRLGASAGNVQFSRTLDPAAVGPAWLLFSIRWHATTVGFMVVGPPRTGTDHAPEDLEFLAMAVEQAAAAIMALRLSEADVQRRTGEGADRSKAAVVHDIKNAVSALSLLARNGASHFADPEFQRDAVATLSRTVERMRRLLVKLSPPAAAAPPHMTEPIDLEELIVEATAPLAIDGKVRLVRRLSPVSTVYGDRDALLRVIENLATNAAEAIDREGTVTVTLAEEQGHAIISVADTGCGIPEEYQERHLFSPFRSTKKGGWGVGLYQTKQVVESRSGEILVQSVAGQGTTFTVKLPLRPDVDSSLESVR